MNAPKLCCPYCQQFESKVCPDRGKGYRRVDDGFQRVRACEHCGGQYLTIERVSAPYKPPAVQKEKSPDYNI